METFENQSRKDRVIEAVEEKASSIKHRLGDFGRRIKRVDLRSQIVDNPLAAVGIAAGVGAVIGLARPMPRRNPLSAAFWAIASTIGFKVLREAAFMQIANYAKGMMQEQRGTRGMESNVPQSGQTAY
jgi:hypothetical protein